MYKWGNVGRPRSKLGMFLDAHSISQQTLTEKTKLNKDTITKACSTTDSISKTTKNKIIHVLSEITQQELSISDFW